MALSVPALVQTSRHIRNSRSPIQWKEGVRIMT